MADPRSGLLYFGFVDRIERAGPPAISAEVDGQHLDWGMRWGGDLAGFMTRLPRLHEIGVRAVWLTPITEQYPSLNSLHGIREAPYHGYCSADLRRIDPHLGSWDDWRRFVATAHQHDMQVIVDIPALLPDPHAPGHGPRVWDDGQVWAVFEEGQWRLPTGQPIDEEAPVWRKHLASVVRFWLSHGADGVRFSHARQLPLWLWQELTASIRKVSSGFLMADWQLASAGDERAAEFANHSGFSMLDYGWRMALVSALAHQTREGFRALAAVVDRDVNLHNPSQLVTFVDHHDFPRFLSLSDDVPRFRLALALTGLARGIPMMFYGNECNLHSNVPRGHDPYNRPWLGDAEAANAQLLAIVAQLRAQNPAVQLGGMRTKWLDADRWVFTRSWLGSHILVAVNRSDQVVDLGLIGIELPDGHYADAFEGGTIEVLDGACRIALAGRSIAAFSVVRPLPDRCTEVRVVGVSTLFGEQVRLVTDVGALEMEYVHGASWATSAAFEMGTRVRYGYEVVRGGEVLRSTGLRFGREVDGQSWVDEW